MVDNRLTVQLIGGVADAGDIRLGIFLDKLKALKKALDEVSRVTTEDSNEEIYFRVVDLQHSSPALVTIEAVSNTRETAKPQQVIANFFQGVISIKNDSTPPSTFDTPALEALRDTAAPSRSKQITDIIISNSSHTNVSIYQGFYDKVVKLLGSGYTEHNSIDGVLGRVNVVNKEDAIFFYLYPRRVTNGIKCVFKQPLMPKVSGALGEYVKIQGLFNYRAREKYPYLIEVEDIDFYPEENAQYSFYSLKGIAPEILGGKSSEDFVKDIRSGW